MRNIDEKNILDSIKKSVESDMPDVWDKIKDADKCKYDMKKSSAGSARHRFAAAAIAACVMITSVGLCIRAIKINSAGSGRGEALIGNKDMASEQREIGNAVDSVGREPDIFKPYAKDANAAEASKALGIEISVPSWLPDGFKMVSSKLYSQKEGSEPYMFNIEYSGKDVKLLTLSISKYMTEQEKVESEKAYEVEPDAGVQEGGSIDPVPPDYDYGVQPGYNPSESPAEPEAAEDAPLNIQDPKDTPVSSGGTTGRSGEVSFEVSVVNEKIKDTHVTMVLTDEGKVLSAYWVYNGGMYNMYSEGVVKDDMIKIVESMIK